MGDWHLLASILDEVHAHSTVVGKIWLSVLFIFRMLVLAVAAEDVWQDEQAQFVCNTEQPGCKAVCYDRAFPMSLVRFWMLQVVFVSAPSLIYIGHVLYRIRCLEKGRCRQRARIREVVGETEDGAAAAAAASWAPTEAEEERWQAVERELRRLRASAFSSRRRVKSAPLRGSLLRTYVLHILTRSVVEVGFVLGQCALFGVRVEPLYRCGRPPCPNVVDCFVSRPTEKTIFMAFMAAIAGVSLLLNALEIAHLGARKIRRTLGGGGEEEACLEDEARLVRLMSEPLEAPFMAPQQRLLLCASSRVSSSRQQRGSSTATQTGPKVTPTPYARPPPPPHRRSPAEVKPRDLQQREEASSSLSSAHSAPGPRSGPRPSGETTHQQRCSLASGAGLPVFPDARRKSSFLQVRATCESMLSIMSRGSSSCSGDSRHGSEGSASELGSLNGDATHATAPPAGRRMSMSVIMDISSIMKKS